jgi:type VI secretion system protein ImpJ
MFLRPQHFQTADRSWAEALDTSEHWDHEYNYGIRSIEISADAIANYQVQVSSCEARLKDGTLISLTPGREPDRLDLKKEMEGLHGALASLKDAFGGVTTVRIYLGVPKLKLGISNVARGDDPGKLRYSEVGHAVVDENQGGNEQDVQLRSLNVRLLLSTQDLSGYELLPIAQVRRAGEGEATPRIDPAYFPPMLAVDAWPPLGRDVVRYIYDLIGQRIEVLTQQILNRDISLNSQDTGELTRLWMLHALNSAYTTLSILAFARGVHPFATYTELCRIVGQLSIFGKARRPPEIPRYDHDDLAGIFYYIKEQIELLIALQDTEFEQRFFIGEGSGMSVRLESKWFNPDWDWYIGVWRGNLSESECRALLKDLDWKLGSSSEVDRLFRERAPGLQLQNLEQDPRALPASRGWLYFSVDRQGAAWKHVVSEVSLAMRLRESLIVNRDKLQGERTLIVSLRNKRAELQFALFAVRNRE